MDRPRPIHFTMGVVRMLKYNSLFYVKTLAIYGVLLAVVHCPAMRNERSFVDATLGVYNQAGGGEQAAAPLSSAAGYPYAKMMNLIEQCRSLESQFHRDAVSFNFQECDISAIQRLSASASKVLEKLRKERGSFTEYIADMRHQTSDQVRPTPRLSRRRSFLTNIGVAMRKERQQKSTRYISQVLNEYIDRMDSIVQRLNALVERVRQEDEAAKARSEQSAKEKISQGGELSAKNPLS